MLRDPVPAGTQVDSFFDVFVTIDLDPPVLRSGTAHAETNPSLWGLSPGSSVPIEMLQLQLVGLPGMLLRESPTLPSTGQTQVTDVGGGQFRIDSFFDVFTELSLDGGTTWLPGSNPLHLELRSSAAPEPGLPALLGLGLAGMLLLRRRPVLCA